MIKLRPASERGTTDAGWLKSRHSFSFNEYYDTRHMGYGTLRVINDDHVAAGMGFPTHGHRDMEIVTYVLDGALEHKDSLGNGEVLRPGEVQRMSAGSGIRHSEFNPSKTDPVHLIQIWIETERKGLEPSYEQKAFPESERTGKLRLVAARDGRDGAVTIHQDTDVHVGKLSEGEKATHTLKSGRRAWVQVARGSGTINGTELNEGDGASVENEAQIELVGKDNFEVILFDMA